MKFYLRNIVCPIAAVLIAGGFCHRASGQSTDLMRARMMGQGQSQSNSSPNLNVRGLSDDSRSMWNDNLMPDEVSIDIPEQSIMIVDKTIEADKYIVGPGDLIGIYFWGQIDRNYQIRITPDGYLMIPTVGSLNIADKNFSDASEIIKQAISRKYKNLETTVFLIQPRRFRLFVTGLVYNPGIHASSAIERVSDVIERAGLIIPEELLDTETRIKSDGEISSSNQESANATGRTVEPDNQSRIVTRKNYTLGRSYYVGSLGQTGRNRLESIMGNNGLLTIGKNRGSSIRSIVILRNGEEINVDLLRFLKLGDEEANPRVNAGDNIKILSYNGDMTVYGEVNDPGVFEFKEGDRISDLIEFSGGLTDVADFSSAALARFSDDGKSFNTIDINLEDALFSNPSDTKYLLKESDRLYIRQKPDYKEKNDVVIYGEVKYPGSYPIMDNSTMLSDIIHLTGGFTGDENLIEARLLRKKDFVLKNLEYERLKKLIVQERSAEENQLFRSIQRSFEGSVNTDFVKLFEGNDKIYDVPLHDGDIIFIPKKNDIVNIVGAVESPGTMNLKIGADTKYYIEKSGGLSWNADKKRVFLLKSRSGQRIRMDRSNNIVIEGGDIIQVPEKPIRTLVSYLREYVGYVSLISTVYLFIRK